MHTIQKSGDLLQAIPLTHHLCSPVISRTSRGEQSLSPPASEFIATHGDCFSSLVSSTTSGDWAGVLKAGSSWQVFDTVTDSELRHFSGKQGSSSSSKLTLSWDCEGSWKARTEVWRFLCSRPPCRCLRSPLVCFQTGHSFSLSISLNSASLSTCTVSWTSETKK